jgi:hypothetical protein
MAARHRRARTRVTKRGWITAALLVLLLVLTVALIAGHSGAKRVNTSKIAGKSTTVGRNAGVAQSGSGTSTSTSAPPTSTSTTVPPTTNNTGIQDSLTGYGATTSTWGRLYGRDSDFLGFPAYGPTFQTPSGPWPEFTHVESGNNGVIFIYLQSLPADESIGAAKADVMKEVPPDSVAGEFLVVTQGQLPGQSCAIWNFQSATLASLNAPSSAFSVEIAYDDSGGAPHYDPTRINALTFTSGLSDSTSAC